MDNTVKYHKHLKTSQHLANEYAPRDIARYLIICIIYSIFLHLLEVKPKFPFVIFDDKEFLISNRCTLGEKKVLFILGFNGLNGSETLWLCLVANVCINNFITHCYATLHYLGSSSFCNKTLCFRNMTRILKYFLRVKGHI